MFKIYSRDEFRKMSQNNDINESVLDDVKAKLGDLWKKISSAFLGFFSHPDVTSTEFDGGVKGVLKVDGKEFVTIMDFSGGGGGEKREAVSVNENKLNEENLVSLPSLNSEIIDVTYDELYDELEYFFDNKDKSMFLWGAPGIGKTQSIIRFAKDHDNLSLIIINTSVKDPTDFIGLPSIKKDSETGEGSTTFNLPDFWPRVEKGSNKAAKPGILFFDELNTAPQPVLVSCQQLILDRKLDNYKVPDNWMVVAAGNRRVDNPSAVKVMSAPLSNRFYHVNLVVDVKSWEKWFAGVAKDSDGEFVVLPMILNFLKNKPEWLHHLDTDKLAEGSPWPSPRTWTFASEKLKWKLKKEGTLTKQDITKTIAGFVGFAAAAEFAEYYVANADIEAIKNIFTDWEKGPKIKDNNVDLLNATLDIASNYVKDHYKNNCGIDELENFINYLISLDNDEFAAALGNKLLVQGFTPVYRKYKTIEKSKDPNEMSKPEYTRVKAAMDSLEKSYPNLSDKKK